MRIRRYYPKGFKGKTYSDEYIQYLESQGADVEIVDNAQVELVLNKEEQKLAYKQCVSNIMNDTRRVLDNLDNDVEFKVNWQDYHKKGYWKAKK